MTIHHNYYNNLYCCLNTLLLIKLLEPSLHVVENQSWLDVEMHTDCVKKYLFSKTSFFDNSITLFELFCVWWSLKLIEWCLLELKPTGNSQLWQASSWQGLCSTSTKVTFLVLLGGRYFSCEWVYKRFFDHFSNQGHCIAKHLHTRLSVDIKENFEAHYFDLESISDFF